MIPGEFPTGAPEVTVQCREAQLILRVPTAWEMQCARQEAQSLGGGALTGNACLLARALQRNGHPAFESGRAVLDALTPGEIAQLSDRLGALNQAQNPSPEGGEADSAAWKARLKADPYGRLRWKVQRAFHALPSEVRVQGMRDSDYLYCALNLILDEEEQREKLCPTCRAQLESPRCSCCGGALEPFKHSENAAFDWARFEQLARFAPEDEVCK